MELGVIFIILGVLVGILLHGPLGLAMILIGIVLLLVPTLRGR